MSIIIRLQGLPLSASSLDIRRFFNGLTIPDGGVHIIGGELGEAFIAFSSDEDARQAMARENEGQIKDSKVKLFLSSRNEMKQVIDKARNQHLNSSKLKSTTTSTNTNNQSTQPQQTTTSLGNRSTSISTNLNNNFNNSNLNSNLSQSIQTDKFDRSANQINYSNNGKSIASNNTNLIANLHQEPPDYRRNRSPLAKSDNNSNRLIKERSNSPFANQRFNQLIDQVKALDNINDNDNIGINSTVRSRLGGFNLPSNSINFDAPPHANKWDTGMNGNQNDGGVMNGLPMIIDQQSRFLAATNNPYHNSNRSSHPYEMIDNPIPFNNQFQPRANRFIIELRGLPINVQTVDFQTFFRPVGILIDRDQIKLSLDEQALFHGVAHIFFNNEKDLEKALLLNGRNIREFPIEVLPVVQNGPSRGPLLNTPSMHQDLVSNFELYGGQMNFNNDLSQSNRNMNSGDSFTRRRSLFALFMKGIPYDSCNQEEINAFFVPIPIFETIIIQERSGRVNGNAYVIFDSKFNYDQAMKRNSRYMGKRYIELFAITIDEIERYRARIAYRNQQKETNNNDSSHSNFNRKRKHSPDRSSHDIEQSEPIYCVQIRGLPPNVDNRDVTAYFLSFGITASGVHVMVKPDGLNAGECFCEFKSPDFLTRALKLDGNRMHNNYILSIREVPYSRVCSIVGINPNPKMVKPFRDSPYDRKSTVIACVPLRATMNDVCAFFAEYSVNLQPNQIEPKLDRIGTRANEQQFFIHFRNPKEADRVIRNLNRKIFLDKSIYLKHA